MTCQHFPHADCDCPPENDERMFTVGVAKPMNTNPSTNGDILDAFVRQNPSADYDDLNIWTEQTPRTRYVEWDDPMRRRESHSHRTYRVVSVANSYAFEEV